MRNGLRICLIWWTALLLVSPAIQSLRAQSPASKPAATDRDDAARKAVLVEVFVSQGCDLCPTAEELVTRLDKEFGAQIVPVSFHVDYFNNPWMDPFSDPAFSQRQMQYSVLYTRAQSIDNASYLYLTPLLMIDGRVPMVASNADSPAKARASIKEALAQPAEVSLSAALSRANGPTSPANAPTSGTLAITVAARSPQFAGREVLIEVATIEDGLRTEVQSGELKGKTYAGGFVARRFAFQAVTLPRRGSEHVRLPVSLDAGWNPARCSLAVLIQDERTGRVLQARRVPWLESSAASSPDPRSKGE